ncbi:hypothetical protein [Listeria ilorinensis]|uniref:hypothetical protein n=1 Tax=Listeria ilorinensis TaxID=2867439 RepID=UPI001EF4D335|nr:hypothetical protein [Listeria ilorinensis]
MENGVPNWGQASTDSYIGKAGSNSMYFDLGGSRDNIQTGYKLTGDEMFRYLNVPALDDAVKSGKQIRFSHNPELPAYRNSYLADEWNYLKEKYGYKYIIEEDGMWYAE